MSDREVLACPECDSTNIRHNVDHDWVGPDPGAEYGCTRCGASFDEPKRRDSHAPEGVDHRSGLARDLLDADPEEVGLG